MIDEPVQTILSEYAAAVLKRDFPRFVVLYANDVHVFDSWDRWEYTGREAWASIIADWFSGIRDTRVCVTARDVQTWIGADVAGGSATLEFAELDEHGRPQPIENRQTVLLQCLQGRWLAMHPHTSVPVDFQSKHVAAR